MQIFVAPHEIRQRILKLALICVNQKKRTVAPHEIRQRILKPCPLRALLLMFLRCTTRDSSENTETQEWEWVFNFLGCCTTRDSSENTETPISRRGFGFMLCCTTRDSSENTETYGPQNGITKRRRVAPHEIRQRILKLIRMLFLFCRCWRCTTRDSSENTETPRRASPHPAPPPLHHTRFVREY